MYVQLSPSRSGDPWKLQIGGEERKVVDGSVGGCDQSGHILRFRDEGRKKKKKGRWRDCAFIGEKLPSWPVRPAGLYKK